MKSFVATVASFCVMGTNALNWHQDIVNPIKAFHKSIDFPLTAREA